MSSHTAGQGSESSARQRPSDSVVMFRMAPMSADGPDASASSRSNQARQVKGEKPD